MMTSPVQVAETLIQYHYLRNVSIVIEVAKTMENYDLIQNISFSDAAKFLICGDVDRDMSWICTDEQSCVIEA